MLSKLRTLLLIGALTFLTSCTLNTPSSGQKIGRIVKLAKEGVFSSTWEGELIRGGLVDGSGSMGVSFHFTIEDVRNLDIAEDAFNHQYEVVITYRVELISGCWRSESTEPHFVTCIKKVR